MEDMNVIKEYVKANPSQRVDIILRYYPSFMGMVEGYTEGLRYMIECEKESNRRQDKGNLGICVQTGGLSDPTANAAIRNVLTREALIQCDFSGGVLIGVDRAEQYMKDAYMLKDMRREYELFEKELNILGVERDLFVKYLCKEWSIADVAEKVGISYESAQQKIHSLRSRVKRNVVCYMSGQIWGIA